MDEKDGGLKDGAKLLLFGDMSDAKIGAGYLVFCKIMLFVHYPTYKNHDLVQKSDVKNRDLVQK